MKKSILETLKSLGFALVAVIFLNSFVLASFQVPTGSMENTVMAGDFLFVNKFIYGGTTPPTVPLIGILFGKEIELPYTRTPGFREPEKGDVIVFIFPGERDLTEPREGFQYYLKRCVATAGDTIRIVDKELFINGKKFDNPEGVHFRSAVSPPDYIEQGIFPPGKPWNRDQYGPLVVPSEGDVIPLNADTYHEWATFIRREGHEVIKRGDQVFIDGKPVTSYTVERDYVFGMGDNRDDSLDSRYWGFIPEEEVVGTPMMVYWSMDPTLHNIFKKIRFSRMFTLID
ncbi:MAG: signal peptidase I [Bacteroidetes bacterium]|nr:signal peptidase I [Bacteroidota bacterium]